MNPKSEFKSRLCRQFKNLLAMQAGVLLLCLAAASSPAQTYTVLHSFGTNVMGQCPQAPLVQGPDGTLYGTTGGGGSANQGQVFKVNPDGTGYTVLKDFTGSDGANPDAGLVLSGTTLYGTTADGGTNGNGMVFSVNTDGSGYTVLHSFTGSDGANSEAGLVLSGTTLYGTTANGGTNGYGTVFNVNTDGTSFTVLYSFVGSPSDGANPYGCLVVSGTTLYGTTANAGSYNAGALFKISTDGSGYTVLYDFGFLISDAKEPYSGLLLSGTTLYGTSVGGGASGEGTVFKINTDGSGCTVLHDFGPLIGDGNAPYGGLLLSGTTLYGTGLGDGGSGNGIVFAVNTDGTGFTLLKDFTNSTDGVYPYAGLMLSGTTLYGTTEFGGNDGYGTVFKVETDGSGYAVVTHFAGGDGASPSVNLTLFGSTLYGTTASGGSHGEGTVFKVNTDGSGYTVLKEFSDIDGAYPQGSLLLSGPTLYGTTSSGGSSENGTVFSINTDGTGFTVLKEFNGSDGAYPSGSLVLSGTALYGTTDNGGSFGIGTVFSINTDGTGFTVLKEFSGSDGADPYGGLVLSGTTLYGTAAGGGSFGIGTVFSINTDGTGFTVLKEFSGSDGADPWANLTLYGSTLYGTTTYGPGSGNGAVFSVNTDGSGYTVLKEFSGSDGANPYGSLVLSGATLYGTTAYGGSSGNGTVFQINTDGSEFAVLKYFSGSDGGIPNAGLVLSGSTFYGVTVNGGGLDSGVVFSLLPGPPLIASPPESQTTQAGSTVDLEVVASGIPPLAYQWFFNGTNAIDGATNSILELTNVLFSQSGVYTVVITNSSGGVTSLVATLTVEDPFINNQPYDQSVNAGNTVEFSVDAGGTSPLSYQWFKGGLSLNDGGNLSGAQTATLTLSNVLGGDVGGYWVVVSNTHSSVTSVVTTLSVEDPAINTQPDDQVANSGDTIVFSVNAAGTPPLAYQWFKDGLALHDAGNVSGAQTPNLTLSNVSVGDTGGYFVVLTNLDGGVTSSVAVLNVNPPGYSILHTFAGGDDDGAAPYAGLVLSGNTLYGTTESGGPYGNGTIFKVNTDGTGYAILHTFGPLSQTGTNYPNTGGAYPCAKLVLADSCLYGTTYWGGSYGWGTVFKLNTNGTDFTVLKEFTGPDGACPTAGLVVSGTNLYGTTWLGGSTFYQPPYNTSGLGAVFKLNTDGSDFVVLKSFLGIDGTAPEADLVLSGTTLYGVTRYDGNGGGTVFKLNTDGSAFSVLYNFPAGNGNSSASLILSESTIYGAAGDSLFKVNTDGTGYAILKTFINVQGYGTGPGTLLLADDTLLGTTYFGGNFNGGTVFKLETDGSNYVTLKNFSGGFDGGNPSEVGGIGLAGARLVFSEGKVYGTTSVGGRFGNGVVFSLTLSPVIQRSPQSQTAELGSTIDLAVDAGDDPILTYQWFFKGNALCGCTNSVLCLSGAQATNVGAYSVVISNIFGVVTSAPAMLNVIAAVERRPVPAINLLAESGSSLGLDYCDALGSTADWETMATMTLSNTSQFYFDLTAPLPSRRFYRVWQTGTPSMAPSLNLNMIPAITLTGNVGDSLLLDYINQFGPTDAWVTLDTVKLTNTSQLYFDVSAIGQPPRLWRIVPVP